MNCRKARSLHTAAAEGRLNEAERRAYEEHLARCARCRTEAAGALAAVQALRTLERRQAPAGLTTEVIRRLEVRPARVPRLVWAPAAVVVAAVLLGYLFWLSAPQKVAMERATSARIQREAKKEKGAVRFEGEAGPQGEATQALKAATPPLAKAKGAEEGFSAGRPTPGATVGRLARVPSAAAPAAPLAERRVAAAPGGVSAARTAPVPGVPGYPAPVPYSERLAGPPSAALGPPGAAGEESPLAGATDSAAALRQAPPPTPGAMAGAGYGGYAGPAASKAESAESLGLAAVPPTGVWTQQGAPGQPPVVCVDVRNAPLPDVLRDISVKTGTEIALRDGKDARVTVHVVGTPEEVVQAVSTAAAMPLEKQEGTLVVGQPATK